MRNEMWLIRPFINGGLRRPEWVPCSCGGVGNCKGVANDDGGVHRDRSFSFCHF